MPMRALILHATLTPFFVCFAFLAQAQDAYFTEIQGFQEDLNKEFKDSTKSPLDEVDLLKFERLPFFKIDAKYRIVAHFTRMSNEKSFQMPTNTDRKPIYVKFGVANFTLDGQEYQLDIFQNQELLTHPEYKDYLFLPFADLSNGVESYGGGRYIDLKIPESDSIIIDFNKAYNPSCAYSHRFSCPLVPPENYINRMIPAGVMIEDDWKVMKLEDMGFSVRFPGEPTFAEDTIREGMPGQIKRFKYLGEFDVDSNYFYQVEIKTFTGSTCPQSLSNEYNDCFKDIFAEKLKKTGGSLMFLQKTSVQGHDTYDFELLAQGKAFSRYRVIFIENKAYIACAVTMYAAKNNDPMEKFFDSFRVLP